MTIRGDIGRITGHKTPLNSVEMVINSESLVQSLVKCGISP